MTNILVYINKKNYICIRRNSFVYVLCIYTQTYICVYIWICKRVIAESRDMNIFEVADTYCCCVHRDLTDRSYMSAPRSYRVDIWLDRNVHFHLKKYVLIHRQNNIILISTSLIVRLNISHANSLASFLSSCELLVSILLWITIGFYCSFLNNWCVLVNRVARPLSDTILCRWGNVPKVT